MKRKCLIFILLFFVSLLPAKPIEDTETYEETKVMCVTIYPSTKYYSPNVPNLTIKLDYWPAYDEVRIYYTTKKTVFSDGEAFAAIAHVMYDFLRGSVDIGTTAPYKHHKSYYRYEYYPSNDKNPKMRVRFKKDDSNTSIVEAMSHVQFYSLNQ